MHDTISVMTPKGDSMNLITEQVQQIVRNSGIQSGVCFLVIPHTTAAITINSYLDPATEQDILQEVRRLVPTRTDFHHIFDTPADAAGHIKATLVGNSEIVLIENGELVLGHSQGLFLYDFDGPRQRRVLVKIIEA
ncbi:MAG: YjbQ family protein [Ardenticatenaceae bacterium]|nr:YjbQ family protein [Ardenticatenaceae bacterium]MCB8975460.1 YjbQ family protein [Ardenticatenaceae bacterium]